VIARVIEKAKDLPLMNADRRGLGKIR